MFDITKGEVGCKTEECNLLNDHGLLFLGIMGGILAFSVLIDFAMEHLEHWLKARKKKHLLVLMKKVTAEMMILGLISFILFALSQTDVLSHVLNTDHTVNVEILELLHMFLFVIVLLYFFTVMLLVAFGGFAQRRWKRYESIVIEGKDKPIEGAESIISGLCCCLIGRKAWTRFDYYRALRANFVYQYSVNFDYYYYKHLKNVFQYIIVRLVVVDWKMWIMALAILAGHSVGKKAQIFVLGGAYNFLGLLTTVLGGVLYIKILVIRHELVKLHQNRMRALGIDRPSDDDDGVGGAGVEQDPFRRQLGQAMFFMQPLPAEEQEKIEADQKKLFWFGKPTLLVFMVQIVIFFHSVYLALCLVLLWNQDWDFWINFLVISILPIFNIFFMMSWVLPILCQVFISHKEGHSLVEFYTNSKHHSFDSLPQHQQSKHT